MPSEDLQKHTLNLYAGDYEKIQFFYPDIGASVVIRKMLRSYIAKIEAQGVEVIQAGVEINI